MTHPWFGYFLQAFLEIVYILTTSGEFADQLGAGSQDALMTFDAIFVLFQ